MKLKVKATGAAETKTTVKSLGRTLQNRILRAAVTKGCKILENSLKAELRHRIKAQEKEKGQPRRKKIPTGLVKGIGTNVRTLRTKNLTLGAVGGKRGMKLKGKIHPGSLLAWLEFGIRPHATGKGSSLRKKIQRGRVHPGVHPDPVLRPVYDAKISTVETVIARETAARIAAAAP